MTQEQYEKDLTPEQRDRLLEVYARPVHGEPNPLTWEEFRDSAGAPAGFIDYVWVWWAGMMLGIEKDGYCHS